jgi:hypothetical protein
MQHIKNLSERREILSIKEIAEAVVKNKDWSEYVENHWQAQNTLAGNYFCSKASLSPSSSIEIWTVKRKIIGEEIIGGMDEHLVSVKIWNVLPSLLYSK